MPNVPTIVAHAGAHGKEYRRYRQGRKCRFFRPSPPGWANRKGSPTITSTSLTLYTYAESITTPLWSSAAQADAVSRSIWHALAICSPLTSR